MIVSLRAFSQKGATLIEVIVALALASVILTAVMATVVTGIYSSNLSKNRTESIRIAEEGVDVVRSTRDSLNWQDFFSTYVHPNNHVYYVDSNYNLVNVPGGLSFCGISSSTAGVVENFYTRTITITDANQPSDRALADVCVAWYNRGKIEIIRLTTLFTKWYTCTPSNSSGGGRVCQ